MSHSVNIHDGSGIITQDPFAGILLCYGTVLPTGPGYARGSRFIKIDGTTIGGVSYINVGTKTSANFVAEGLIGAVSVSYVYGDVTPIDMPFFVADRQYLLLALNLRPIVAGTDGSAVTAVVRKPGSGIAPSGGSGLQSSTFNLKGTINVNQSATLVANTATLTLSTAEALAFVITGVPTAARGVLSALLLPV